MLLRNRMLSGGVSFLPFLDAEKGGAPGAAAAGGGAGGAGAGAAGAAGAAAAAAAATAAGGAAAAGAGAGEGGKAAETPTLAGGGADPAAAAAAAAAAAGAAGAAGKLPDGFDFRAYLAGGDKDAEKDLAKYADPRAVYKSLRELQSKISKGELKAPAAALPADATPEQKAEWRKANGLPENAEGYVKSLKLPDGLVVGAADKPLLESFAKSMFEGGATQAEMDRAVTWYYQAQDQMQAQLVSRDGETRTKSQGELISEWGAADYKINMNAIGSLMATMPDDLKSSLLTARTADGRMVGDTAEFNRWAAQTARELNPMATIVSPGADSTKTVDSELAAIKSKMYLPDGKENPEYWKGPEGEKLQARFRELTAAQQKVAARGRAA